MSAATSSPRSIDDSSLNHSAFKSQIITDPFLSNPSSGEEQLVPSPGGGSTVNLSDLENNNLTGQSFNNAINSGSLSVSATNFQLAEGSKDHATYSHSRPDTNPSSNVHSPTSHLDFLSPSDYPENGYSDISSYGSPGFDQFDNPFFLEPDFDLPPEFDSLPFPVPTEVQYPQPLDTKAAQLRSERGLAATSGSSQLLSPVLTNTPSPPPDTQKLDLSDTPNERDMATRPSRRDIPAHLLQHTPALTTTSPCSDSLEVNVQREDQPTSPIVKVSSYTRGDSPSRADAPMGRSSGKRGRTTLSSIHLAPVGDEDDDDDHYHSVGTHYRSISVPTPLIRADDGSWAANPTTGQGGLDPTSRGSIYVLSPKELSEKKKLQEKNADVEHWLSVSEANSEIEDNDGPGRRPRRRKHPNDGRPRAKSTGDPSSMGQQIFDDSKIPGPGVLIDEDSGVDDEEDSYTSESIPESPPANVDLNTGDEPTGYFPPIDETKAQDEEPLPRQFIRARPWQDPPNNPRFGNTSHQPSNSNAAIMRFQRQNEKIETASRAATWGTRRLSESDVDSVIGANGTFRSLGIGDKEKKRGVGRRSSIFDHASKIFPRRSNSNAKRKLADSSQQQPSTDSVDKTKNKDTKESGSVGSILPQRKPSFSRSPRSPLKTGNAVLAMTGQIAAVGGGGPVSSPISGRNPWNRIRRSRSKSDLTKGSGGLLELMTNYGGPPVPTLASPLQDKALAPSPISGKGLNDDEDDEDDDEIMGDKGVSMEFPVRADPIVPTPEGFKTQVQQLNPRLTPVLVERIAQEQVRRYKKLVDLMVQHSQAVSMHKCSAGKRCFAQGGEAEMLPPRISSKDPDSTYAQFQVSGSGGPDDDLSSFGEGTVTAALFPPGVPLPPVKRLPAQFECSLCFKVKSFQKPSDWTKHVHEDVMPFTCTFPNCTEPKSFKRKADWVRHESERHRQLEWWTCSMPDCSHTCYRKDNFVQHLVREHKMPEPKVKATRGRNSGNSKGPKQNENSRSAHEQGLEQVWRLVEECHHTTAKQPTDEACRFCGNVLTSWKKLSVHMAKHMEQIAMPVLELVRQRAGLTDHISPVDMGSYSSHPQNTGRSPVAPYTNTFQVDQPTSTGIDHTPYYNPGPQNSDAYVPSQQPLIAEHLRTQNELAAVAPAMSSRSISNGAPAYNLSPYSQSSSPSIRGQNVYPITTADPQQFGPHLSSATYPPPYNAVSRQHNVSMPDNTVQTSVGPTAYTLNVSAAVGNGTAYDNQPQMYTSPVESLGYVYQQGQGHIGQSEVLPYTDAPAEIQYPVMSGPSNAPTGGQTGYIQHNGGQYQYHNQ
ncbi:hypothetical protein FQN53_008263 [Emmonsiellopsis sp. PD_33]|nr:hypothetical protein FQN53_008263 [Emmonsiellopsis sp. PD_33]